ncbi:MAG: bifunctional 5,10-methylenetetrahydrofolate dehydrogenase/5,10-methenyltetrahydrofolate cyclohydrolase [Sediminibacterium sp.]|nr:bifunctional 5,10-methylenetetrahydrofolate dehydrogenase/5,10-methenyltetrahydrofolate cyclohydrolase [Sediminibacterium sp.]
MIRLDGKIASQSVKQSLKIEVDNLLAAGKRPPHLAAVLVGSNGASETYVASKVKTCEALGFASTLIRLPENISQDELVSKVQELNRIEEIDGILVQLPLPKHINESAIIEAIDASKDVDGFHPISAGRLTLGLPTFIPATPYGIQLMLEHFQISTSGKHAVVIGRSNIVGRPMSILLSQNHAYGNATVTLCHSKTPNLEEICKSADILVAALGKPGFVKKDMVKPGAVVIDVGITRMDDSAHPKGYKIVGDVDFDEVAPISSAITPVPGGVGLMTIAGLMKNTLLAYQNRTTAS